MLGEALRDRQPERSETEPGVVAYHFAQAGLKEAAVEWWGKAGDLALRRSANIEAIAHLENALELSQQMVDLSEQRRQHLRLQIIYGNALRTVRGFAVPETKAAFARARDIAATMGDVPERFSADYGLSGSTASGDQTTARAPRQLTTTQPSSLIGAQVAPSVRTFTPAGAVAPDRGSRPPLAKRLRAVDTVPI